MPSQHRALEVMIQENYADPDKVILNLRSPYHHSRINILTGDLLDFENLNSEQQQLVQSFRDVISANSMPEDQISRDGLLETSKHEFPGLGTIYIDSYEAQLAEKSILKAERIRQEIWNMDGDDRWDESYFRPRILKNARVYAPGTEESLQCLRLMTVCDAILTHKFNNDLSPRDAEIVEIQIRELDTEQRAQRRGEITEDELQQRFENLGGEYNRGWGCYEIEIHDPVTKATIIGSTDLGITREQMDLDQHALLAKFYRILESKTLYSYKDLEGRSPKMHIRDYENEYIIHGLGHLKVSTMEIPLSDKCMIEENPHWKNAKFSVDRIERFSRFLFLENFWDEKINLIVATQDQEWDKIKSQRTEPQIRKRVTTPTR